MQLLTYAIAFLLVLASMTYVKLQSYRSLIGLESSFKHYMEHHELSAIEEQYSKVYDLIHVQDREGGATAGKAEGSSRLSFHLLIDREAREKNPEAYLQTRQLFKQLMRQQYGQQPFFDETKHPQLIDQILDSLQQAADQYAQKLTLQNAAGISRFQLPDPELHYIFYLMLEGLQVPQKPSPIITQQEDLDDENEATQNSSEINAKPGYVSLLNYTTAKPTTKVRVFLASPALLMAIYEDHSLVEEILEKRYDFYKQIRNNPLVADLLSKEFKELFSQGRAAQYNKILNFAVTNTNPRNYE